MITWSMLMMRIKCLKKKLSSNLSGLSESGSTKTNIFTGTDTTLQISYFFYRDQLNDNVAKELYLLLVDIDDVNNFDQKLSAMIRTHPNEYLKIVRNLYKNDFDLIFPQINNLIVRGSMPRSLFINSFK